MVRVESHRPEGAHQCMTSTAPCSSSPTRPARPTRADTRPTREGQEAAREYESFEAVHEAEVLEMELAGRLLEVEQRGRARAVPRQPGALGGLRGPRLRRVRRWPSARRSAQERRAAGAPPGRRCRRLGARRRLRRVSSAPPPASGSAGGSNSRRCRRRTASSRSPARSSGLRNDAAQIALRSPRLPAHQLGDHGRHHRRRSTPARARARPVRPGGRWRPSTSGPLGPSRPPNRPLRRVTVTPSLREGVIK